MKDLIINKLQNLSDAEIRDINKDAVSGIINELKQFLMLSMDGDEVFRTCEET